MRGWWRRRARKWYSYWDLRAAHRNLFDIGFRESNGEMCPMQEHREAEEWLLRAQKEYMDARGIGTPRDHW